MRPDGGRIIVGGEDVTELDAHARAERGVVRTLQATAVFPASTALDNVVVGAGGPRTAISPAARALRHSNT